MIKAKTKPQEIFAEYEKGRNFKSTIKLYDRVKENENFFLGKQWENVNAPSLQKPVFNILKRVVNYFVSVLVSDDFAVSITPFMPGDDNIFACEVLSAEINRSIEKNDLKSSNRDLLRDCAVDGDACYYLRFDPDAETGQTAKGEIVIEQIDNTKVYFGNPYTHEVVGQPYIIFEMRKHVDVLKAQMSGKEGFDLDQIKPDNSDGDNSEDLITVLVKLYMENGTVWYTEVIREAVITPPTNTEYRRYPVAYMCWERVKNSCHGQSAVEGLIPNQKAVNTLMAAAIAHTQNNGFPITFFDKTKLDAWPGGAALSVGINGNPNEAFSSSYRAGDMSSQVMQLVTSIVDLTKDLMGASDAALGNIKPDNTSAIVAVQRATAAPLDLQRKAEYKLIEDVVRIKADIISVRYGKRYISTSKLPEKMRPVDDDGKVIPIVLFDFSIFKDMIHEIKVDIGASAYFSELMQLQTLDNLLTKGFITDAVTYLEALPDFALRHKHKLIADLKKQREMASAGAVTAQPPAMAMAPVAAQGGELDGVL